jgi:hypothetical protein
MKKLTEASLIRKKKPPRLPNYLTDWCEEMGVKKERAGETRREKCLRNVQVLGNVHDDLQINIRKQSIFSNLRIIIFAAVIH